jgi:exopolyphosphatase/guanosine-5'-triphosphate,3'-diphosphate pyrophosphatase
MSATHPRYTEGYGAFRAGTYVPFADAAVLESLGGGVAHGQGMRIAAVDVGSNSIHMIIAQVESDGRFHVLDRAKEMVRLGRGSLTSGQLSPEAMTAGVRVLSTFRTLADRLHVDRFKAVATSAVREAVNGGDFIQRVKDEVGLRVQVIPGREEARLIYLGVRHAINLRGAATVVMDVGGGSVEFIFADGETPVALESVKLGVARLSERFFRQDPPTGKQIAELEQHVAQTLDPLLEPFERHRFRRVVGTSGTLLNLITMAGYLRGNPPDGHLNNFTVSADDLGRVRRMLVKSDREERLRIKGLDAKRVDLIVAGACLFDHVLRRMGAKEVVACTWSLREGVLLDFVARHAKGIAETEQYGDPRHRSVVRLARHLGETGQHGSNVARLALQLFDQLHEALRLPSEAREWLDYAAFLHDVGHHIRHQDHQRHSYYLITNGELLGFQRQEIEIIGLIARYHRKAAPKDGDEGFSALSKSERRIVRSLSAILRIADGLDRSHYAVVRTATLLPRGDRWIVQLDTAGEDAELEVWEARRRMALLEEVLDAHIEFQVLPGDETRPAAAPAASAS